MEGEEKDMVLYVMDVNTGELLFDGEWPEVREWLDGHDCIMVPQKLLYTSYGFNDENPQNIWVVLKKRRAGNA